MDETPNELGRHASARTADALAASLRDYLTHLQEESEDSTSSTNEGQALLEVAQIVVREPDPDRLRATCLKRTATLLDLDSVRLYEVGRAHGELRLTASQDNPRATIPRGELGRGLDALRNGRPGAPVCIEEVLDAGTMSGPPGRGFTVLSVPVFIERELWGVLQAAAAIPRRIAPTTTTTLEAISGLMGGALTRLALAERERCAAHRLRSRSERIVALLRRLRDVRASLEGKNVELADAMELLRRMDTFKDAFLSSISHEMRTPLTIIRSYVDLLIHYRPESREREEEFLRIIDAETTKLTLHINKILDLTEIRANEVQIRVGVNAAEEIARSAITSIQDVFEEQGVVLESRIPEGLPNLLVDRERTIQILVDLLDNAAKFSPAGAPVVLAAQESPGDRNGPFVTFWVADQGIGIEPSQQVKIFDQFVQVTDAARGKPRGIGLGLPICKAYAERMGGRMWLESQPGRGATFYVSLPGTREPVAGRL